MLYFIFCDSSGVVIKHYASNPDLNLPVTKDMLSDLDFDAKYMG